MARVLVTGALGFVGLNIARRLALGGWEVTALTRRDPDRETLAFLAGAEVHWVRGDVTDRQGMVRLVAEQGVSHLLHAAALTATPEQEREAPARVFEVNAGGTLNLLEAARLGGLERFVYVSSSAIYGTAPPDPPKRETDPLAIGGLYSVAKQASEHLCRRYAELCDLQAAIGRLGTAYGPMERETGSRQNMSGVTQAVRLALGRSSLRAWGAGVARDFCHIDDVAEAFARLLGTESLGHDTYNVAGPRAEPLRTALEALAETLPEFSWHEVSSPEEADLVQQPHQARATLDLGRLLDDTGWQPRYGLADGVRAYLGWLATKG